MMSGEGAFILLRSEVINMNSSKSPMYMSETCVRGLSNLLGL
jgi:hypothetical protein